MPGRVVLDDNQDYLLKHEIDIQNNYTKPTLPSFYYLLLEDETK